jgi:hypothetical protein
MRNGRSCARWRTRIPKFPTLENAMMNPRQYTEANAT